MDEEIARLDDECVSFVRDAGVTHEGYWAMPSDRRARHVAACNRHSRAQEEADERRRRRR